MNVGYTQIEVAAATGQILRLSHNTHYDEFTLSVHSRRRASGEKGARIAFMIADDDRRPRLAAPNERYGETHYTLWLGRACVDVTESVANTVKAWIDSRPRKAATAAADTQPREVTAPAARACAA